MSKSKIKSIDELCNTIRTTPGSPIITACSGSFDVLHAGHVSYLQSAKQQGDLLVVFLNSDLSIKKYKGPNRPINKELDRARVLSALECVDFVVIFDDLTPLNYIEVLKPHIFCNGAEWGPSFVEKSTVEAYGGKMQIISPETRANYSSSEIISKLAKANAPQKKAIFLDRDGVLIEDRHYVHKISDVYITDETIRGLKLLTEHGWPLFVVTNQSGINRGLYSEEEMELVHNHINNVLKKEKIHIEKYYFCPHTPEEHCACRKPKTGMLEHASTEAGITLAQSWLIGDKITDIEAGKRSNMHTILISNLQITEQIPSHKTPQVICNDLYEAALYINKITNPA